MRNVKVGIIGCGGIANGKHMPALSGLSNVEMVAFESMMDVFHKAISPEKSIPHRMATFTPLRSETGFLKYSQTGKIAMVPISIR